jgi:hypothetical protein
MNKTFLFQEKLVQPILGKNSKTKLLPLNIDEDFIDDGEDISQALVARTYHHPPLFFSNCLLTNL